MTAATRIDELTAARDTAAERIRDHNERVRREAEERFAALGGCGTCRGRGWVVTWDTLDCMQGSYAEYDSCGEEDCTALTRGASGYHPTNLKYDRNRSSMWYPPAHEEAHREQLVRASERANAELYDEVERWTPAAGKLVEVVKAGGGKEGLPRAGRHHRPGQARLRQQLGHREGGGGDGGGRQALPRVQAAGRGRPRTGHQRLGPAGGGRSQAGGRADDRAGQARHP